MLFGIIKAIHLNPAIYEKLKQSDSLFLTHRSHVHKKQRPDPHFQLAQLQVQPTIFFLNAWSDFYPWPTPTFLQCNSCLCLEALLHKYCSILSPFKLFQSHNLQKLHSSLVIFSALIGYKAWHTPFLQQLVTALYDHPGLLFFSTVCPPSFPTTLSSWWIRKKME